MSNDKLVLLAGLSPEQVAPIARLESVRINRLDAAGGPPSSVVLIVCNGAADTIATVRGLLPSTPILALLEDPFDAPAAAAAGADYVLPLDAPESLVVATYTSACREADLRNRKAALARSNQQLTEAQTRLLHSSSLAALGHMAAGVAHEINNPLQYVLAGIDEIAQAVEVVTNHRQTLADMREGAERIRAVTRSLLPFARSDAAQFEQVDLNEIVVWCARVSANEIRHRAQLELKLAPSAIMVGQRLRLGQLVTNLLANASHAITEGDSDNHRIVVTTEVTGRQVQLSVEDTGTGIPEEIRAHIFDPFFTTKKRELGNGLGLALCAEVATRHRGTIVVESRVGAGSRFIVTFGENLEVASKTPVRSDATLGDTLRSPRVLIIDDEEPLVRTYKRFLKNLDVVAAVGGKAALEILARDVDFDVILCDLMMPNVDGPMVHAHIEAAVPQLLDRIVFCTGGAFTPRVREFLARVPNEVLDKPIGLQQLRQVLDKRIANR